VSVVILPEIQSTEGFGAEPMILVHFERERTMLVALQTAYAGNLLMVNYNVFLEIKAFQ